MKIDLEHLEIQVIRFALNKQFQAWIDDHCPLHKTSKDTGEWLNKYHQWCDEELKDKYSDIYWIQKIRKKLYEADQKILANIKEIELPGSAVK